MGSEQGDSSSYFFNNSVVTPLFGVFNLVTGFVSSSASNSKYREQVCSNRKRSKSSSTGFDFNNELNVNSVIIDVIVGAFWAISVFIFSFFLLRPLRLLLDYPIVYLIKRAKRANCFYSPDGKQALENIHLTRDIEYMNDSRFPEQVQRMDKVSTLRRDKLTPLESHRTPIVYFHGGGHVCVNKETLIHSITPFTREGFTVYAVEYPLSPDYQFPLALLTGIRAICEIAETYCPNNCIDRADIDSTTSFIEVSAKFKGVKSKQRSYCEHCGDKLGVSQVNIVGDSAGGNIASMITLILSNPEIREEILASAVSEEFDFNDLSKRTIFPKVHKLISVYGVLSRDIGEYQNKVFSSIAQKVLAFLLSLYKASPLTKTVLCDYSLETVNKFADNSLILCGTRDPLFNGNLSSFNRLSKNKNNFKVQFITYPANHAFHGLPVRWAKYWGADWKKTGLQSTYEMLVFLTEDTVQTLTPETFETISFEHFDFVKFYVWPILFGFMLIMMSPFIFLAMLMVV